MPAYEFHGKTPFIGEGTWVAPGAYIIGDVRIGRNCWIGPCAVLRGDFGSIVIGDETAVEDGVVVHTPGQVLIGSKITIGHLAIIHNSIIGDYAVIGMHSTLSDNARVGCWSIVAEHSLVKKNQIIPDYKIFAGVPAAEKGEVTETHQEIMRAGKQMYLDLVTQYKNTLKLIEL